MTLFLPSSAKYVAMLVQQTDYGIYYSTKVACFSETGLVHFAQGLLQS